MGMLNFLHLCRRIVCHYFVLLKWQLINWGKVLIKTVTDTLRCQLVIPSWHAKRRLILITAETLPTSIDDK
jgi:hypothetical protein